MLLASFNMLQELSDAAKVYLICSLWVPDLIESRGREKYLLGNGRSQMLLEMNCRRLFFGSGCFHVCLILLKPPDLKPPVAFLFAYRQVLEALKNKNLTGFWLGSLNLISRLCHDCVMHV